MKEAFYRARMKLKDKTTKDLGLSEANNMTEAKTIPEHTKRIWNELISTQ